MAVVGALTTLGLGIYNAVESKKKEDQAEEKAAKLERERVNYIPSKESQEALSLTESELANGMSARTSQAYEAANDKGLSTSLSTILKGGGNVNNVGELYGASGEGRNKLALIKDSLRLNQINNYLYASNALGTEKQTAWQINKFQPQQNAMEATGIARQQAEQAKMNSIGMVGVGLSQLGQAYHENQIYNPSYPTATSTVVNPNSLQYNPPTNNVASPNPTSFDNSFNYNNDLVWNNPTDVYGNPANPAPTRPM